MLIRETPIAVASMLSAQSLYTSRTYWARRATTDLMRCLPGCSSAANLRFPEDIDVGRLSIHPSSSKSVSVVRTMLLADGSSFLICESMWSPCAMILSKRYAEFVSNWVSEKGCRVCVSPPNPNMAAVISGRNYQIASKIPLLNYANFHRVFGK